MVRYKTLDNVWIENDNHVHCVHPMETNFTFCGEAICDDYDQEFEQTTKKVTCPRCIQFIDYCKSFKETDLKRVKNGSSK